MRDPQAIRDALMEQKRLKNDFKGKLKVGQRNAQKAIRELEGEYLPITVDFHQ